FFELKHWFFFSSRRRHTRFSRDWSSDVCSSDLGDVQTESHNEAAGSARVWLRDNASAPFPEPVAAWHFPADVPALPADPDPHPRSEERRVGKESRSG